jgi:hypothetical protein
VDKDCDPMQHEKSYRNREIKKNVLAATQKEKELHPTENPEQKDCKYLITNNNHKY